MILRSKPSSSGNARVWVKCPHRKYTVRRSKVADIKRCERCEANGANGCVVQRNLTKFSEEK